MTISYSLRESNIMNKMVKYEAKANHDDLHEEERVFKAQKFLLATPVGGGIIVV